MLLCGLQFAEELNRLARTFNTRNYMQISTNASKIRLYVVAINEAQVKAENTKVLVLSNTPSN
jgi:hypothetical protein